MNSIDWLIKELEENKLIKLDKLSTYIFKKNYCTRYELIIYHAKRMYEQEIESASMQNFINSEIKKINNHQNKTKCKQQHRK